MTNIPVTRLPVDNSLSGWEAILPEHQPTPALVEHKSADFLVIGGGFTGLSAARRLSQLEPTARIVLLEASGFAKGPAGRNSGFMIDLPHDLQSDDYGGDSIARAKAEIADNREAIEFAKQWAQEAELPSEALDPCGKLNGACTPAGEHHNVSYSEHLTALGEPHELLDADQMKAVIGIDYYTQGLFAPGTVMIQPAFYVRAVAKHLASNRVSVHEHSAVTALRQIGKDWVAETNSGSVTAPKVILAVNGHLNSFGFAKNQIMHVFTYGSMTRPLTDGEIATLGGRESWGITPADPMGTSVRKFTLNGEHRIIVRNRFTYDPSMEVSESKVLGTGRDHDRAFYARFPMFKGMEMQYCWGGRLALTRNGVSIFGEVAPGVYSACVQNGLGVAKGTFQGIKAAEMAVGTQSPGLKRLLDQPKAQRLMPEPFMSLGATGVIRFNEWKANAEL